MLKSCQYCGKIHDSKFDCGKKPVRKKRNTESDKFRWSKSWQRKRAEIRTRDNNLCQICIRNMYMSKGCRQYEYEGLSVHHAIPIEEGYNMRLDSDNLLTTCGYHHEMAESGEIPYEVIKRIIKEQEKQNNDF